MPQCTSKKLKKKATSSDNGKKPYEATKISALVSELERKKNTVKKAMNNADIVTDKDTLLLALPLQVTMLTMLTNLPTLPCPSCARISSTP
jgi:hypothetical protein